ncbi:MAG: Cyclic pyranopterin monophosphate synthase 2 [Planctomycetes bacterium]|nr:Cyclic pyranopterin monophosphate synthase 2 [Planctomycetota bacterium]
MVDVSAKDRTVREATAESFVRCGAGTLRLLRQGKVPKGDAIAVARLAAIQGAKRTPDLIPLCHPVALTGVDVAEEIGARGVRFVVTACAADRTGVEMEALTGAAAAALALYDMVKSVERGATIERIRLLAKSGGRSGAWRRPRA